MPVFRCAVVHSGRCAPSIEKYKDTAFFYQLFHAEPLSPILNKAPFIRSSASGLYHGYPRALNINVEGRRWCSIHAWYEKLVAAGQEGRMSTWGAPLPLMIEAGVDYAIEFCEGRTNGRSDKDVLLLHQQSGQPCEISTTKTPKELLTTTSCCSAISMISANNC